MIVRLLLLLLLLLPRLASAQAVVVGPTTLDPGTLAEELGLVDAEEAALLVIAGLGIDGLSIGFEPIALSTLPGIERHPPLLVRGLPEGLANVSVRRGLESWDGQLRLFAGRVTRLDVDAVLRESAARKGELPAGPAFDLFGFYDVLDAERDDAARLTLCAATLAELPADGADHRLVSVACDKVAEAKARADDEGARALLGADELGQTAGRSGKTDQGPVRVSLVYRRDGRPRRIAGGSEARFAIAGASLLGAGIFLYSSVFWEVQAQTEYLAFRDAERVGDTLAMSRHLFFTRSFDRRRDASAVGAGLFLTSSLTAVAFQAIEEARFRAARKRLIGEAQK